MAAAQALLAITAVFNLFLAWQNMLAKARWPAAISILVAVVCGVGAAL